MASDLRVKVIAAGAISPALLAEVQSLCGRAYAGENLGPLWAAYAADGYVIGFAGDLAVSHAMVVTRWLQAGDGPRLRTAYVELVATLPEFQGRGFATAVMERLGSAIATAGYDLGGLCPADTRLYQRLGWEYWRGPLFIRPPGAVDGTDGIAPGTKEGDAVAAAPIPTPEERVMILRLPNTPPLDLDLPLSAEWRPGGELW